MKAHYTRLLADESGTPGIEDLDFELLPGLAVPPAEPLHTAPFLASEGTFGSVPYRTWDGASWRVAVDQGSLARPFRWCYVVECLRSLAMLPKLLLAATAAVLTGALGTAVAAPLAYNFVATLQGGPLTGDTFPGTISFDPSGIGADSRLTSID